MTAEAHVFARPSLHRVLRRAMLAVVVLAVMVSGSLLTLFGAVMLRNNAAANLQLVARSAGYTVEAAVVFHDRLAITEALTLIAAGEDVAEARVYDYDGHLLVRWTPPATAPWRPWKWLQARMAWMLPAPAADVPILHGDAEVGRVMMRSAGGGLVGFVLSGIGVILGCLALSALAAAAALQRVLRNILAPLRELAEVARAGRVERTLDRRVSAARIAEFHDLGEDVNALLAELQARQQGLQRENIHLAHRAATDSLTGTHNRAYFEQRLARAVADARPGDKRLAVLFLDGDHFKQINDRLGHDAGDAVLVAIAARVRRQLREQDTVARLGGDEFAVLLDGLHDPHDAWRIAGAIDASMAEPVGLSDGRQVLASLSIGLAVFPDDAQDAAGLLRAADAAMYRGKRARSSGVASPHVYQEGPDAPSAR